MIILDLAECPLSGRERLQIICFSEIRNVLFSWHKSSRLSCRENCITNAVVAIDPVPIPTTAHMMISKGVRGSKMDRTSTPLLIHSPIQQTYTGEAPDLGNGGQVLVMGLPIPSGLMAEERARALDRTSGALSTKAEKHASLIALERGRSAFVLSVLRRLSASRRVC